MYSILEIKNELKKASLQKLVFPEGNESKIQAVAQSLVAENLAQPVLLFDQKSQIPKNLDPKIITIVLEELDKKVFIDKFLEIRKEKANLELATKLMTIRAYVGTMMMKLNQVDGMVCGLTFTTADTLRPALQIIKIKPQFAIASSVLVMKKAEKTLLFTDCGLNIHPSASQLADITKMGIEFARDMNILNPEAVLLSYSTKGSGSGDEVSRVQEAMRILEAENLDFNFDGELQFDAAIDQEVRLKKAPNSKLKKPVPDLFVFPELQSGNIGYKIAQRLGGYEAIGPFILGLNQPVNDLSRGANFEDILNTAIITAFQALKGKNHDFSS